MRSADRSGHGFTVGGVLSNLTVNPRIRISHCTVRDNRGRGLLISAKNVIVDHCTFTRTSGPAVLIVADGNVFKNGRVPADVTVQNCDINDANAGAHSRSGMIETGGDQVGKPAGSRMPILSNIVLRDLTFKGPVNSTRIFASTSNQAEVKINTNNSYGSGALCPVKRRSPPAPASCQ